jgi:mutator protein MutT
MTMKTPTPEPGADSVTSIDNMKKASIAIIKRDQLFLTVSRRDDLTDMGFPGGKIEDEESEIAGLVREVREETGIEILSCRLITIKPGMEHEVHVFEVIDWSGQPQSHEGTSVRWLTAEELSAQKTFGSFNGAVVEMIDNKLKHNEI